MRATPLLLAATCMLLLPGAARAADPPGASEDMKHDHPSLLDRPHTIAQLEAGIIALPTAPISQANQGGGTPIGTIGNGDATVQTGVHLLYRATREWAVGAGVLFAPRPTSDTNYSGGASQLPRTHKRSYLFLGAEARYFPVRSRWFEVWFGLDAGALVISDRFSTDNAPQVPSILGLPEVTIGTEGAAVGLQVGGDYLVNDNFVLGLALRADRWVLPSDKRCDPIGDCSTLTGSVGAFEVGLTFGYRIPL